MNIDPSPCYRGGGQPEPQPLPNSEQMFQLGKMIFADNPLTGIRFFGQGPVINKGTIKTMKDAHATKNIQPTDKGTFTADDGDTFTRLLGTRNGVPVVRFLGDHAETLNGMTIVKIHTWPQIAGNAYTETFGFMVFEVNVPS